MKSPFLRFIKLVAKETRFPKRLANSKTNFTFIYIVRLFFRIGLRLWQDNCPRQAAALTYQTFLSIVPILFLALAASSFFDLTNLVENLITFFQKYLVPQAADTMADYLRETASSINPGTLGLVGGGAFILIGSALFFTVEKIINEIFGSANQRPFYKRILICLVLIPLTPSVIGLSFYQAAKMLFFSTMLSEIILPLLFTTLLLFLAYRLLPHRKTKNKYALISAVVTGIGLELSKMGFALYAKYLGDTLSYVYGAMAIVPLFMIWVYLIWLLFLFGAQLNASFHEVKHYNKFNQL